MARRQSDGGLIYGLRATAAKIVMLKADNAFLELFEFAHPIGASGQSERPVCDVGITHICVDDVETDYARLVRQE